MGLESFSEDCRRVGEHAHGHGLRVMSHSCGSVAALIPRLIDAELDILDPVQTSAAGMEPRGRKGEFGERIVSHGAIDTQQILPRSCPEAREGEEALALTLPWSRE